MCFARIVLNKWLEINLDVFTWFNIELCHKEIRKKIGEVSVYQPCYGLHG